MIGILDLALMVGQAEAEYGFIELSQLLIQVQVSELKQIEVKGFRQDRREVWTNNQFVYCLSQYLLFSIAQQDQP